MQNYETTAFSNGTSRRRTMNLVKHDTVRALSERLSGLSVFHSKSLLYGAFVWARRVLNSQKRRFPARAGGGQARAGRVGGRGVAAAAGQRLRRRGGDQHERCAHDRDNASVELVG
jgi:hypothetical protein